MVLKRAMFEKKWNAIPVSMLFLALFLLGLCIRMIFPELRIFHIDEAIHAWMSYELSVHGTYIYDPKYHGPLLYYLMAAAFSIFGDNETIARLIPGIAGACLVPAVYVLYKLSFLSKNQSLIIALCIAISPNLVYFSRFLRHDIFQLLFIFLCIVCIFAYLKREKWYFALFSGVFVACALCLKEEVPATLAIIFSFFCIMFLLGKLRLPKTWKRDGVLALAALICFVCAFYSSFFTHPEMLFQAASMGLSHWLGIQAECRLCGPPYWYFLMLLLYELPILVLGIYSVSMWLVRENGWKRVVHIVSSYVHEVKEHKTLILPYKPLKDQEFFFLFCVYWLLGSLALYGVVNEKVPWLLIHQLLPLIFVAGYAFQYLSTKKAEVIFVLCTCYLLLMMVHVAFIPITDLNEPIVQVHHAEEVRGIMPYFDASTNAAIVTVQYWPFPWYYRDLQASPITFYGSWLSPEEVYERDFDLVIAHGSDSYPALEGFTKESYKRSYWFSWDNAKSNPFEWFLLRNGEVGYDWYDVFWKGETLSHLS